MPPFVGQISLFSFNFQPPGWVSCNGQLLQISDNEVLFNFLRNTFGGDGQTTFAVPNLQSVAPNNCQYCISLFGNYGPDVNELLTGQTMISAFSLNTRGILECAGQSLPTAQYRVLETLIGTQFGGDGTNNFNLPDLRSIAPANCSYIMAAQGIYPGSRIPDMFLGTLLLMPYQVQSTQALRLCDGELLPIAQYTALYSLLGTRFGGDGNQTFALPNLGAAAPSKFNYYICVQGMLPPRG